MFINGQLIRNVTMTDEYIQSYHQDSETKQSDERRRQVRPEEIIRLHETLLQNVEELLKLKVCADMFEEMQMKPIAPLTHAIARPP